MCGAQVYDRRPWRRAGAPCRSAYAGLRRSQIADAHRGARRCAGRRVAAPDRHRHTFSAAVCATATQPEDAARLLRFMASHEVEDVKRQQGMQPA